MGKLLDIERPDGPPQSPIASLQAWGFWCKYESVGIDDELRTAMLDGDPTDEQQARVHHLISQARDWLIALEPESRRPS